MAIAGFNPTASLRFAARSLLRTPIFSITVIALLALGIGANTAIFSLVREILLRSLPVRQPDRLVLFGLENRPYAMIPRAVYRNIRDHNVVLENFAAITFPPISIGGGEVGGARIGSGSVERLNGLLVSGNFFETLGVRPLLGRAITPADDHSAVCVLGYGLWRRRFAGDPAIVGKTIPVSGRPFTVIGITPKDFFGLSENSELQISIPLDSPEMRQFDEFPVEGIGRLRSGITLRQAQASLDPLYRRLTRTNVKVQLQPGNQGLSRLRRQYERPLLLLMAVAGLVLAIASANVANLLMARGAKRAKEIAIRVALGAGRARLVRDLLAESLLLSLCGALSGVAVAWLAQRALLALAPKPSLGSPINLNISPDWIVLAFALCVAVTVSVLCGIAPAIRFACSAPAPVLKGSAGIRAPGRLSLANALVIAQIALSLVLLIGAGLFLKSLRNLRLANTGLNPDGLLVMTLDSGYEMPGIQSFFAEVVSAARRIPGVISASPAFISPLSGGFAITHFSVPGYLPWPGEPDSININWVGTDYFRTIGATLLAGREFNGQDGPARNVAIVNEKAVRQFWAGRNPIGKRALLGWDALDAYAIVGVVKDVRNESVREDAKPSVYVPFSHNHRAHMTLHVRAAGPAGPVFSALVREVNALNPGMPTFDVMTTAAQIDNALALDRMLALLTTLFGILAGVVAITGLYGIMAFTVAANRRDIGIRMALGASRSNVLRQVLMESASLVWIGIALGIPAALWAGRFAASFLYGLSASDPITYAVFSLFLSAVALVAAWIPARRAATVDPMVVLRYE
jgi:predicted permease